MLIIIGFLFSVLISALVCGITGLPPKNSLYMFIDFPSALLTLIFVFFFLFVSKSGNIIGKYIKSSFKKNYN